MKSLLAILALLLSATGLCAAIEPVTLQQLQTQCWVGQRVRFSVLVRAPGSFTGTTVFELPEVPGVVILKTGPPVLGSESIDGRDWLSQRHAFSLFALRPGTIEVPSFTVRYTHRQGYSGPAQTRSAMTPGFSLDIIQPPGTGQLERIITCPVLEVEEHWEPTPGPASVGQMFTRTIVQRADQMTAMALAAPPLAAPDGLRVYAGPPTVTDRLDRGNFRGERTDTLTYLIQRPGSYDLPPITYSWWDPERQLVRSAVLPTVRLEVPPTPGSGADFLASGGPSWQWLLLLLPFAAAAIWQRHRLTGIAGQIKTMLRSPHQTTVRTLLAACRRNDPAAAARAWYRWQMTLAEPIAPDSELHRAALELMSLRYGTGTAASWEGSRLARAVIAHRRTLAHRRSRAQQPSSLPPLNP